MPKNTTGTDTGGSSTPMNPADFGVDRAADTTQRSLTAIAHLHSRLIRNALEVNAELLDFARRRVGEDISTSERLSRSRNPAEATEVMNGFYQKALKDYTQEAEKIMKIGTDAARRSIEETQAEADEVLTNSSER